MQRFYFLVEDRLMRVYEKVGMRLREEGMWQATKNV